MDFNRNWKSPSRVSTKMNKSAKAALLGDVRHIRLGSYFARGCLERAVRLTKIPGSDPDHSSITIYMSSSGVTLLRNHAGIRTSARVDASLIDVEEPVALTFPERRLQQLAQRRDRSEYALIIHADDQAYLHSPHVALHLSAELHTPKPNSALTSMIEAKCDRPSSVANLGVALSRAKQLAEKPGPLARQAYVSVSAGAVTSGCPSRYARFSMDPGPDISFEIPRQMVDKLAPILNRFGDRQVMFGVEGDAITIKDEHLIIQFPYTEPALNPLSEQLCKNPTNMVSVLGGHFYMGAEATSCIAMGEKKSDLWATMIINGRDKLLEWKLDGQRGNVHTRAPLVDQDLDPTICRVEFEVLEDDLAATIRQLPAAVFGFTQLGDPDPRLNLWIQPLKQDRGVLHLQYDDQGLSTHIVMAAHRIRTTPQEVT